MTSRDSSVLRRPLDEILGTRANVQLLRVLTREEAPLGRAEAARRAGITPQGGRKALDRLFRQGVVRLVGAGSPQQVILREDHPLAPALTRLFDAEARRHRDLFQAVKSTMEETSPPPEAAWIQGAVAEEIDDYGDPLVLGILGPADEVDETAENLRERLVTLESDYDVTIEVRPFTRADLVVLDPEETPTVQLWGPEPGAFVPPENGSREHGIRQHRDHDRRSQARARGVADLLRSDPDLRDRALEWVREQLEGGDENRDLREWERILRSASIPRIRRLLTANSERAVRLRQSLPFWAVLTDEQRHRVRREGDDES